MATTAAVAKETTRSTIWLLAVLGWFGLWWRRWRPWCATANSRKATFASIQAAWVHLNVLNLFHFPKQAEKLKTWELQVEDVAGVGKARWLALNSVDWLHATSAS